MEPPVVQTDTGTDTEVKSSFQINPVLSTTQSNLHCFNPHSKKLNNSSDNISVNSTEYNSAESGDVDVNMNTIKEIDQKNVFVGKLTIPPSLPTKVKESSDDSTHENAGADSSSPKSKRNFVIPQKHNNVTSEFVSKFPPPECQPLLIIRRTPSKISLPKEVGKPKTMVNTSVLDTAKYFGPKASKNKPPIPLKRSETMSKEKPKSPLVKQTSLPETADEMKDIKTFNFEPEDSDLNEIDNYIENLIANEDELHKPIDRNKYKMNDSPVISEDEKYSSSIEDLLRALETETTVKTDEIVETQGEEKIDDLLTWIEGLEHQSEDKKLTRSFSDVKYKNLEKILKIPTKSDAVISKIPKQNLTLFESHLLGKESLVQDESDSDHADIRIGSFGLKRSKTEISCTRSEKPSRSSVDLEATSKVNIKKMLQKFESTDEGQLTKERSKSPVKIAHKRNSFAAFKSFSIEKEPIPTSKSFILKPKPIKNTIKIFENTNNIEKGKPPKYRSVSASPEKKISNARSLMHMPKTATHKVDNFEKIVSEKAFSDLEKFVENTLKSIGNKYEQVIKDNKTVEQQSNKWCANVTVRSIPNDQIEDSNKNVLNDRKRTCENISAETSNTVNLINKPNENAHLNQSDMQTEIIKGDCNTLASAENTSGNLFETFPEQPNKMSNKSCETLDNLFIEDLPKQSETPYQESQISNTSNSLDIMKYLTVLKNVPFTTDVTNDVQYNFDRSISQNDNSSLVNDTLQEEQIENKQENGKGEVIIESTSNSFAKLVSDEQPIPIIEAENYSIKMESSKVEPNIESSSNSSKNLIPDEQSIPLIETKNDFVELESSKVEPNIECSLNSSEELVPDEQVIPLIETKNYFVKMNHKNLFAKQPSDDISLDDNSDVEDLENIHSPHDFSKAIESTDTSIIEESSLNSFNLISNNPSSSNELNQSKDNLPNTVEDLSSNSESEKEPKFEENLGGNSDEIEKISDNVDSLYAEVHKKEAYSPPVPQRQKRHKIDHQQPTSKLARQRSFEKNMLEPFENQNDLPPIAPLRRSQKKSPVPSKKSLNNSSNDGNELAKEVVKTYHLPQPQAVTLRSISPDSSTSNLSKSRDRSRSRDSDVECCIQ